MDGFVINFDTRGEQIGIMIIASISVILYLVIPVLINFFIAKSWNFKPLKFVIIANILTQIILLVGMLATPISYILTLIVLGFIIFGLQYLLYRKVYIFKSKDTLMSFLIITNLVSLAITFIVLN